LHSVSIDGVLAYMDEHQAVEKYGALAYSLFRAVWR
jgi:hypothetical protein